MTHILGDYVDMVDCLNKQGVEFVIVGAYAVTFHGSPRLTEDIDFLVRPTTENTRRLKSALRDFGSPVKIKDERLNPHTVIQIGVKPVRIDIIASITGVKTDAIWEKRIAGRFGGREVFYVSYELLLKNKIAVGRSKDLLDAENLKRVRKRKRKHPTKRQP